MRRHFQWINFTGIDQLSTYL